MSTPKKAMAVTRADVTLEDMENFLKRAFHALHPKKGALKGEIIYDLFLSHKVGIRVWTSIGEHQTVSAPTGADAIRVQLYNYEKNRPMMPGKAPIVKRTQGWKDNLQDRIEDYMEAYDAHEEDIEAGKYIDWSK